MVVLKNITNEKYKDELKNMIVDHYTEKYGEEWIDNYLRYLESKKKGKVRDLLIKDAKRYSTKNDSVNRDMNLLFNNKETTSNNVAFGLFIEEELIGYMILTIHTHYTSKLELDRYGELYRFYIKPEYRTNFVDENGRYKYEFVSSVEKHLIDYFKNHNIEDILACIPSELKDLVSISEDMGFIKASIIDGYVNEKNKNIWIKRIKMVH